MQRLPLPRASFPHEGAVRALRLQMPPRGRDAELVRIRNDARAHQETFS